MNRILRARFGGLLLAVLACAPAQADVLISQIYGGGGNSGATLKSDFIELFNNGAEPVALSGWSVQYASATGSTWQRTNLSGSIAAGGYYLVKQADGAGGSVNLPAADATGTIAMSASNGKVALVGNATTLSGTCPAIATLTDLVGYGSANCFQAAATPALNNTTAALRKDEGCTDSDNNGADFVTGAPAPRNSASPLKDCAAPPPPVVLTAIGAVQGSGNTSPLLGEVIAVEGTVTARKSNGFFVQSADAETDGDPATSEGLFVFTTSAGAPAQAQPGNRVQVRGTVTEFTPSSAPHQLSLSQLTFATTTLVSTGNALPAAVELGTAELNPAAAVDALERFEGMRVSVPELIVTGPSLASINETQATAASTGVIQGTLPGVARPAREEGVAALDVVPFPPGVSPPVFDTNPEVLRVDSDGAGGPLLSADAGASLTGLVGVLDYGFNRYTLLPDPGAPVAVSGGRAPAAVAAGTATEITVASFNIQRFFDGQAGNNTGSSPTLTPEAFAQRMEKTANALCEFLHTPDILGIVEVEGIDALSALAEAVNANLPGTCARNPQYLAFLVEGNDIGGIDSGFLVSTAEVAPGLPRVQVHEVVQEGKDALIDNPNGSTSVLNDRPPLRLMATVNGANGVGFPLTVIANHLRSLSGINDLGGGSSGWASNGERVRDKRLRQALFLAELVQARQLADPAERIVLTGDFNAFEFNDGYVDSLGIISGLPAPADQVLRHADSPVQPALLNLTLTRPAAERYSFVFDGNTQTLDHILVNQALADAAPVRIEHARIDADFGVDNFGDFGVPVRVSDHDPVVAYVGVPAFVSADLAVDVARPRIPVVIVGHSSDFALALRNNSDTAALEARLTIEADTEAAWTQLHAPEGWACEQSTPAEDRVRYACARDGEFAAGATAGFTLSAAALRREPIQHLTVSAVADSASTDPVPGNDSDAESVLVVGRPAR